MRKDTLDKINMRIKFLATLTMLFAGVFIMMLIIVRLLNDRFSIIYSKTFNFIIVAILSIVLITTGTSLIKYHLEELNHFKK